MNHQEAHQFLIESLKTFYTLDELKAMVDIVFSDIFNLNKIQFKQLKNNEFIYFEKLNAVIKRLKNFEPLQHIVGFTYFKGLKINVNIDVLIPRPETEELIEWILEDKPKHDAVFADICTGSGCIALVLKKYFDQANITATDISEKAIETAIGSEKALFKNLSINFIQHNCLIEKWKGKIPDIVISNPPYIGLNEAQLMDKNVMEWEPHIALFTPQNEELSFYKAIIQLFIESNKMPIIYFELNPLFASELKDYCYTLGLECILRKDMFEKIRFAKIFRQ